MRCKAHYYHEVDGLIRCDLENSREAVHLGKHVGQGRGVGPISWSGEEAVWPNGSRCEARHPQHPDWRCKWNDFHDSPHLGGHAYTDPKDQATYHWDELVAMYPAVGPVANPARTKTRDDQVGGAHYKDYRIQPWDIWQEYGLNAFEGAVLKYLLRRKGDRLEDLKKARHTLDRLIEIEEAQGGGT